MWAFRFLGRGENDEGENDENSFDHRFCCSRFVVGRANPYDGARAIHRAVSGVVKDQGGVLDIVLHTLTIKCSPKNIPQELVVDITDVGLGQPLHASDVVLPEGVKLISDSKATVLTIHQPRGAENVAAVVAGTEPEVITKGKKEAE